MSASEPPKLLTKKKLWAAFFVQLNEAYQITVLMPMVVFMCRDFGISPHMLGVYTSLLNASFMFCQFLVSYFWGSFSDIYGRRIALVIGLTGSTIGILVFGVATSYPHAMIARCVCGLSNGNLGVIKAWLSDITDSTNRSFAFSILAISFGFGNVLGSMMGGLLILTTDVDLPDDEYIKTVGIWKFWIFYDDFPFLLPCLVGAIISANSVFWTLYQVKHENQSLLTRMHLSMPPEGSMGYAPIRDNDTDSDLLSALDHSQNVRSESGVAIFETAVSIYETNNSSSLPMLMETFVSDKQKKPLLAEKDMFNEILDEEEINSLSELLHKTDLFKTLLCYVIIALCTMMFREMNPVYMAQALTFDSQYIGYVQAWSGFTLLWFTFWCQPYFLKSFQHRNMGVFNSVMAAIVMALTPSIYWTVFVDELNKKWIQMIAAFVCESLMVVFVSILFVVIMCFINNSVPPTHCGKANGLAQSSASLLRAIGPIATGFIWSESVLYIDSARYTVYWAYVPSFVGFVVLAIHLYCFIKPQYQFTWEKQMEMKQRTFGIRKLGFRVKGNVDICSGDYSKPS